MAVTKNFLLRAQVLDRLLRSERGADIHTLLTVVNSRLESRGVAPVRTKDTILKDMTEMANERHLRIRRMKDPCNRRRILYRYENTSDALRKDPLTPVQVNEIKGALAVLDRFSGFPQLEWVEDLCALFRVALEPEAPKAIQFEESCCKRGMEYFTPLFYAIVEGKSVSIIYQRFSGGERRHVVSPYFLKQFSRRWYLVAKTARHPDSFCIFSLDRIVSLHAEEGADYIPPEKSIGEYFKDVYGITCHEDKRPVTIRFYADARNLPYLLTCPVHDSQTVLARNHAGAILSVRVVPNTELVMRFLSYGEGVIVLGDTRFRGKIVEKIRKMLKKYESST